MTKETDAARRFFDSEIPLIAHEADSDSLNVYGPPDGETYFNLLELACAVRILNAENAALRARVEELEKDKLDATQILGRLDALEAVAHKEFVRTGPETGRFEGPEAPSGQLELQEHTQAVMAQIANPLTRKFADPETGKPMTELFG